MKYLNKDGELVEAEVHLRTAYNYDTDAASELSGLACEDPSLAQQQFKDESDINTIVKRFGLTGQLPDNIRMPTFEDFTEAVSDYHTAVNLIKEAEAEFLRIPADLRERFDNDPQNLMDFLGDSANLEEARELGLVKTPVPDPVIKVEVQNPVIEPAAYTPPAQSVT